MIELALDTLPHCFARLGVRKSKGYEMLADGELPPPVYIGRASRLPQHEINAVAAAIIAGATPDDLRVLAVELVAQRAELAATAKAFAMGAST